MHRNLLTGSTISVPLLVLLLTVLAIMGHCLGEVDFHPMYKASIMGRSFTLLCTCILPLFRELLEITKRGQV